MILYVDSIPIISAGLAGVIGILSTYIAYWYQKKSKSHWFIKVYYSALHIWLNACIFSNCLSRPNIMTNLTKFSKPDKISSLSPTPMALTCSKDLRGRVAKWCEEYGYSYKKLAELSGCSNGTISNILQYQQLYSQSTHPFSQRPGMTQIFYHTDVAFIYRLLQRQHSIHLDEVQAKFREDRRILKRSQSWEYTARSLVLTAPTNQFPRRQRVETIYWGLCGRPVQRFRSFYFSWIYNLGIHWC